MTTYGDLIEKSWRRIMGSTAVMAAPLGVDYTAGSTQMVLSGVQMNTAHPGGILAVDQEVFFINAYNSSNGIASVIPGYQGSTPADHSQGTLAYVDPRVTRFDIGEAINDSLNEMTAVTDGMYWVPPAATFTYNPVYQGYDLGALPHDFVKVLEVRYATLPPYRNFPLVKKWKVLPNLPDPVFPSGQALVIYEAGYPGRPFYVSYAARYNRLVNLTDDVTLVAGLQSRAIDIPVLGAEINLTIPMEIRRNFTDAQPDARKAPEVPPGAITNTAMALMKTYFERIDAEASTLNRHYARTRW